LFTVMTSLNPLHGILKTTSWFFFQFCVISKLNPPALILSHMNLKSAMPILSARLWLLQIQALMVDSQFLGGMLKNVCPHWLA
jgi:hypothetical protein